ncbi:type VI secretion system tip protein VgrG [Paraburkholderia fungorum]|uniref:type VI secretion system Vgr family protein n=3 Tax=Paraburkholderia fungorum TaxID=134537 RepID=UPI000C9C430A|nr:type VI secretion system Vgr family protein [Paraburkholderia fungorum]MBB5547005.1 type VI secretion system secreted protein VgrG [Paraburkholderia fungorum]PNE55557.1 type VI secretion system tip protein VgrG [Paraburkholderia fungorum]
MGAREAIGAIKGGLSQQDRLLKLDTPAGNNVLLPHRVIGQSRIGRDYLFMLDCVSTSGDVQLKTLIAQAVTLWIQQTDSTYLPHHGYVHMARRLGSEGSLTTYQLAFSSWMHFLKFRRDQKHWQDKSADAIISDVFNEHPQARGMFRFVLSKPLPTRSYCRQGESDWNFVHRLLESEGLYGIWQQASDGKSHTLVITDRLQTLEPLSPRTVGFYRAGVNSEADALMQWSGTRTLQSVLLSTRTFDYKNPPTPFNPKATAIPTMANQGVLPAQTEVYEYTGGYTYREQERGDHLSTIRMQEWESQAKRFHGAGGLRAIDAGRRFMIAGHPVHDQDSDDQREFAAIEVEWAIENNLPLSGHETNYPHSLSNQLTQARADDPGKLFSVAHGDGSTGFYRVSVEAQRTGVPYRSPFEHRKPEAQLESAIVVGPKGQEAYTDELNRVKVLFVWDRINEGDERASCWVRVAQSDTGNGYGGVHMPRAGEELIIGYIGNDIDRPIALHRVYNGAAKPQCHSNGLLSGFRSKEFSGSGFNQMVMDDATAQNRVQLYSSSTNAQLHLGYLIDHTGNTRGNFLGSGFDLSSEAYGALRAGRGLYVSTHPVASQPLDARVASNQLVSSEGVLEAASQASETSQAESLKDGHAALKAFTDATQHSEAGATGGGGNTAGGGTGNANAFTQPVMLFAAPAGIALSTQKSAHVATDQHINLVSGQSTHIATGKSLVASVTQKLSLFVQNAGMKLFAAKGKIEVQAHADNVELTAQKSLLLVSATEKIQAAAQQEILLTSGGAYIRIKDGNIEIHAPGTIDFKGANFPFSGPTRMDVTNPAFKDMPTRRLALNTMASPSATNVVPAGMPYKLYADGALIKQGVFDNTGQLPIDHHVTTQKYTLEMASGVKHEIPVPADYRDAGNGALANQGFQFHENGSATDVTPPGDRAQHRQRYSDLLNPPSGDDA